MTLTLRNTDTGELGNSFKLWSMKLMKYVVFKVNTNPAVNQYLPDSVVFYNPVCGPEESFFKKPIFYDFICTVFM